MRDFPIGSIESRAMARMRAEHIRRTKKRIEIISNVPRPLHTRPPSTTDSTPYAEAWQETQAGVLLRVIYHPGEWRRLPIETVPVCDGCGTPFRETEKNAVTSFGSRLTVWRGISEIGRNPIRDECRNPDMPNISLAQKVSVARLKKKCFGAICGQMQKGCSASVAGSLCEQARKEHHLSKMLGLVEEINRVPAVKYERLSPGAPLKTSRESI